MEISLLALSLAFALAFANGTNDVSKAIATLVGSGVTDYRSAIAWGTAWTVIGAGVAAFVASAMIKTFSHGLVQAGTIIEPTVTLAVLIGAMVWVLFASITGFPVSTTHALTGAIVGTGLVAFAEEGLIWGAIGKKIALPLLLSPLLALTLSLLIHPTVRALAKRWDGACLCVIPASRALVAIDTHGSTRILFQKASVSQPVMAVPSQCDRAGLRGLAIGLDTIHWVSSGLASFARGTNDAPKIVAILLIGSSASTWPSASSQLVTFGGIAIAMGLGSYFGGLRVTEVLAEKVTRMNHAEGLSANLVTSTLVLASGSFGLPVSTTHISSSAIIGIGLLKGQNSVHWRTVREIVLAWVVTLPISALLACIAYLILTKVL
jgi:PiT family inorganic phosphate transporter